MSLIAVAGPPSPGPGEREGMLEGARQALVQEGIAAADIVRIDVPGRGAGEEGEGTLRAELEPAVPILQSGSLFGGRQGLLVVDAPGKKHRKTPPPDPEAKSARSQANKMRMAKTMEKTHRRRGRG